MPAVTGKVEGKRMKKILIAVVPFMLAGCSYYNQFVERMQTDTLEYQCDQKPLTVHRNNARQQVSFIYDNQQLNLSEGLSASGRAIPTASMCSGQKAIPPPSISATASSLITVSCRRPNVEISVRGRTITPPYDYILNGHV